MIHSSKDDLALAIVATLIIGIVMTPIFGLWIWLSIGMSAWWLWVLLGDDGILTSVYG